VAGRIPGPCWPSHMRKVSLVDRLPRQRHLLGEARDDELLPGRRSESTQQLRQLGDVLHAADTWDIPAGHRTEVGVEPAPTLRWRPQLLDLREASGTDPGEIARPASDSEMDGTVRNLVDPVSRY